MREITPWFERAFPEKPPIENFPFVIERLRGAPVRVRERVRDVPTARLTARVRNDWSIQEHVGHLGDLEPLWYGRVEDFMTALSELRPADLTNQRTYDADHNSTELEALLRVFAQARARLVARLESMTFEDAARTSLHPRLKQPMRVLDLCTFVADHDDHHMAIMTEIIRAQ